MNPSSKPPDAGEQTIFDTARQMPDEQVRSAYLNAACAGDAPLRQRVEKLLKAGARADEFLARNPLGALTSSLAPSDGERDTGRGAERPGTIIGHYKLLEKVGEGGFGVVYMAEQKQPIKRRVALKIIKVGMDTREVVARFEAERQALAVMDHPNIAKVFDAGATDRAHDVAQASSPASSPGVSPGVGPDGGTPPKPAGGDACATLSAGRPYFVMELVRGIKITDYCDEKNLSTRERLDLFAQVCQAVQHAHQKGIIHRDLKPSNILVTVNDGVAVPKIIDFGIAKATQMELTEKTVFTRFHQFLGTPAYMSPEQTEITSVDIDTRSDIYSLGVLLYELLTGKTPFDTKELLKAGLDEMRRTIREVEPVKPSTRLTQELTTASARRSLKGGKGEREKRGTERAARGESLFPPFPSAPFPPRQTADQPPDDEISLPRLNQLKQLIPALRGDLDWIVMKCLEKDRARRYESANGLATEIQRHLNNEPVVACPPSNLYRVEKLVRRNKLAFAAGAGIAAALVIGLAVALWQSIEKTHAYNRAVVAEQTAKIEAQFLKDMLQDLGPSVTLGHDPTMVREILDRAASRIDRDLSSRPEIAIELRTLLAATYGELGLFDKMDELARTNLVLARVITGEESLPVANVLHQIGEANFFRDKQQDAERFLRECLSIRRRILGNEHLDVARTLHRLGSVLHSSGKSIEAEAAYREGLAICRGQPGEKTLVEADLLGGLAVEVGGEEAELSSRQSVEIKRKLLGEHPSVVVALNELGLVLTESSGVAAEGEKVLREALVMSQKLFGRDHPLVGKALALLGKSLERQDKLAEAEKALRDALAIRTNTLGNSDREAVYILDDLGSVLAKTGRVTEAADCYRTSREMRKKRPESYYSGGWLMLLRKQGKFEEAEAVLRDALEGIRKEADAGSAFRQNTLAWILATWPDSEIRDGHTALFYAQKAVAATSRRNAGCLDTLAAAYAESGEFAAAVAAEKEAIALMKGGKMKAEGEARLKLYESGRPYREPE